MEMKMADGEGIVPDELLQKPEETLDEYLTRLDQQLAESFGWGQWKKDPWNGDLGFFCFWLLRHLIDENEALLVYVLGRTWGKLYLAQIVHAYLQQWTYAGMSAPILLDEFEWGLLVEDRIENLKPVEQRWTKRLDYTEDSLPPEYLCQLLQEREHPYEAFFGDMKLILSGRLAAEEIDRRGDAFPEAATLARYVVGRVPYFQRILKETRPDLPVPDPSEEFAELWEGLESRFTYLRQRYSDVLGFPSEAEGQDERVDPLWPTDVKAQESIFGELGQFSAIRGPRHANREELPKNQEELAKCEEELAKQQKELARSKKAFRGLDKISAAAFEGKLGSYLAKLVNRDVTDEVRKEKLLGSRVITESRIDSERQRTRSQQPWHNEWDDHESIPETDQKPFSGTEEESFLDTRRSQDDVTQEHVDLSSPRLDFDRLTPREREVVEDVKQALAEGYSFDSKTGGSFRQKWGKDYAKKIKAWNRAKAKLRES